MNPAEKIEQNLFSAYEIKKKYIIIDKTVFK